LGTLGRERPLQNRPTFRRGAGASPRASADERSAPLERFCSEWANLHLFVVPSGAVRRLLSIDASVLLACLAGVGALHLLAHVLAPPLVALADLPAHEGGRVAVEARVLQVHRRSFVLAQEGTRALALGDAGAQPGDVVRAVGLASRLSDGVGLSTERVEVLVHAGERPLDPAALAAQPRDYEGARVLLRGEAREGALVGGGARVKLDGEPPPPDARGLWLVAGTFHYRTNDASFALRADAWSRSS
jgi:hypothetical protein